MMIREFCSLHRASASYRSLSNFSMASSALLDIFAYIFPAILKSKTRGQSGLYHFKFFSIWSSTIGTPFSCSVLLEWNISNVRGQSGLYHFKFFPIWSSTIATPFSCSVLLEWNILNVSGVMFPAPCHLISLTPRMLILNFIDLLHETYLVEFGQKRQIFRKFK